MPITPDKIEMITNFHPGKNEKKVTTRGNVVGKVEGFDLVHDVFAFQGRAVHLESAPLVSVWRRQPTLALVGKDKEGNDKTITLAYPADVASLDESTAEQVVNRVEEARKKAS